MRTEKKIQAVIALLMTLVMGGAFLAIFYFKEHSPIEEEHKAEVYMDEGESYSVLSFLRDKEEAQSHDLLMKLPAELDLSVITYDNNSEGKTFSFSIPGIREDYFRDFFMAGTKEGLLDIGFEFNDRRGLFKLFCHRVMVIISSSITWRLRSIMTASWCWIRDTAALRPEPWLSAASKKTSIFRS